MKIYVAGPFFNENEKEDLNEMLDYIRRKYPKDTLFIPMEHFVPNGETMPNNQWANFVYKMDIQALENSQYVIAMYTGHYSDTGTAFEIGYAVAKQIPVFLYIPEKYRDNDMSIMPIQACTAILNCNRLKLNQK